MNLQKKKSKTKRIDANNFFFQQQFTIFSIDLGGWNLGGFAIFFGTPKNLWKPTNFEKLGKIRCPD